MRQNRNFGRREFDFQTVSSYDFEKQTKRVPDLLIGKIIARGQIEMVTKSILDSLADNHFIWFISRFRGSIDYVSVNNGGEKV